MLCILEVAANSTSVPGTLEPGSLTLQTLDHLQTGEGPVELSIPDSSLFTQGALESLVSSLGIVEPLKSEHRKPGHLSNMESNGEISPCDRSQRNFPSAPHASFGTKALVSYSSCQGSQESLLATREGIKTHPLLEMHRNHLHVLHMPYNLWYLSKTCSNFPYFPKGI